MISTQGPCRWRRRYRHRPRCCSIRAATCSSNGVRNGGGACCNTADNPRRGIHRGNTYRTAGPATPAHRGCKGRGPCNTNALISTQGPCRWRRSYHNSAGSRTCPAGTSRQGHGVIESPRCRWYTANRHRVGSPNSCNACRQACHCCSCCCSCGVCNIGNGGALTY